MRIAIRLAVFAAALGAWSACGAAPPKSAEFDKMRTLVGDWDGVAEFQGQVTKTTLSVRPISNGTSLMETLTFEGRSEMVTIYHPFGQHMMLTHYCSSNTQPRMRTQTAPADLHELYFDFLDATNMMNAAELAMHSLRVVFGDATHFTQEWFPQGAGMRPVVIKYRRRK